MYRVRINDENFRILERCFRNAPSGTVTGEAFVDVENWMICPLTPKIETDLSVMQDSVNHPAHYNSGRIEVIEFIEDQKLPFDLGNTVKYIARAGKKDQKKTIEDLKKARWYLNRRIELTEAENEMRDPKRPNEMNP